MYYVSVETTWWKDRDTIEASSHRSAALKAIRRAFPKHDIPPSGCRVTTKHIKSGRSVHWFHDGETLTTQSTRSA